MAEGLSLPCIRKAKDKEQTNRSSPQPLPALFDLCISAAELTAWLREAGETRVLHVWNLFLWLCEM